MKKAMSTQKVWNEIVMERGVDRLRCPVCGRRVLISGQGLNDEICRHVLFVHDWIGEFAHVHPTFRAAVGRIEGAGDGERAWRDAILQELPQTGFVLEFVRPQHGSDLGDTFTVAFDLAKAEGPVR